MRTRSRLSVILSIIAAMALTSGCAPEQLQRFKETMNVVQKQLGKRWILRGKQLRWPSA
jgi:hypothetical protein